MSDMAEAYKEMRKNRQKRRRDRLKEADDTGWGKYTSHHWYKEIKGIKVEYWPSTGTFRVYGQVKHGDVNAYISKMEVDDEMVTIKSS